MMDANVLLLVLAHLDLREVAAASQVCSTWCNIIRGSDGLWRQLQQDMLGKLVGGEGEEFWAGEAGEHGGGGGGSSCSRTCWVS